MDVRHAGRIVALGIPSERATQRESHCEEPSNREIVVWTAVAEQGRACVLDSAPWAPAVQRDRPDVVERNVAEKRVAAQVELLEVGRLHAHAHDQCS